MKRSIFFLVAVYIMLQLSGCQYRSTKEPVVTEEKRLEECSPTKEAQTEYHKPFGKLTIDDVESIRIYEASLESDITLTKDDVMQMISLLNELVTYQKVEEEERIGQMVQIKIHKSADSSIVVKCLNPYVIIDDSWYEAEYMSLENINKFVNDIIKE